MICSLICFGYSLSVNQQADYKFTWNQNGAFLVVLALTLLNVAVVLCLFIIHKTVWQRAYNKLPKGSKKYIGCKTLNTCDNEQWWNQACEEEFADAIKAGVVKPYILKKKKKKKVPKQAAGLFGNLLKPDQVSENLDNLPKVHPVNDDE